MEEILTAILAGMGGAALVVGGLAAWLGSVWKDRVERQENLLGQIDVDLRTRRIDAYQALWASTKILPKWPRNDGVTYEQLKQFAETLRDWYFGTGGMFLSHTSREAYSELQDKLRRVIQSGRKGPLSTTPTDDYEVVRERCSALRTRLSLDIASRREAIPRSAR